MIKAPFIIERHYGGQLVMFAYRLQSYDIWHSVGAWVTGVRWEWGYWYEGEVGRICCIPKKSFSMQLQ